MAAPRKPLSFDAEIAPTLRPTVTKRTAITTSAQDRQQVGARVDAATYRKLKARAALQGTTVQTLVERAITEFLVNHEG
jgi:predicted HicB family RNase H-like nuclease